jgi:hypothetical protein
MVAMMMLQAALSSSLKFVEEYKSEDLIIGWIGPEATPQCAKAC